MNRSMCVAVEAEHAARKREVQNLLASHGLKGIECSGVAAIYRLEGDLTISDAEKVGRDLLCDSVAESFSVNNRPQEESHFFADVWFKPGVTDAVGDSVRKAIADLKVKSVDQAFSGTRYEFTVKGASNASKDASNAPEKTVQNFVEKELLNPLVQECQIIKR